VLAFAARSPVDVSGDWMAVAQAAPSQGDRAKARKLAGEAMDLFAAGDFAAAYEKFSEADELVPAPTLKLRMARSLDKLDRLQEAVKVYREVIAYELDRFAPAVHRQARKQAVPELAALLEQVPKVVVTVEGPQANAATVTMDGGPFPPESLGEEVPLDPGVYRFEAREGERVISETVELGRGVTERVALALPMLPEADDGEPTTAPPRDDGVDPMVVAGWTAIGIGGLGLIVGGATGIAMLAKEGGLEERCPNRQCPPAEHDAAREFDRLRVTTTVGLVVAGLGAGAGVTLLLLAPTFGGDGADEVSVTPFVGPFGGGLVGAF
jgi:hypothetical protein